MTTVMMNMLEPLFLLWTQKLPNFLIVFFFYLQWCAGLVDRRCDDDNEGNKLRDRKHLSLLLTTCPKYLVNFTHCKSV